VTAAAVFFEGAGGSTCGLRDAGYDTHGYENWLTAVETARANGHHSTLCDLSHPGDDYMIEPADVAWFSPPCQPFSAAGDQGGEFDDRDGFPWTLRIIDRFRFPIVFIENVKGLTFSTHHAYFAGVLEAIRQLGYQVEWKVLNCADYGIVLACPLHDTQRLTSPAACAERLSRCVTELGSVAGATTWTAGPLPTHVATAAGLLVSRIGLAFAGLATCDERERALEALSVSEAQITPLGEEVAMWTTEAAPRT
jgi:hypothetical protein